MGQAPPKLTILAGKHVIRFSSKGYVEWSRETEVGSGSEMNVSVTFGKPNP
jgi:hypothetical protein